jgi:RNA polymerase sigma factor (sigma-70 family)
MADDFASPRQGLFPTTHRSAVVAASSDDPAERARSFEILVRAYWKPVYKHVRLRFRRSAEEAEDLTQGFFARSFEQRYFSTYDPGRALFRTYLKTCLDRFVTKEAESARRQKRGGGAVLLSLDFAAAEREVERAEPIANESIEGYFDHEWTRNLLATAVDALREECAASGKSRHFRVFERYVLEDDPAGRPSYAELARELEIQTTDVTNYLAFARREFRRLVLEKLREITSTEEEFRAEATAVLGVAP